MRVFVKPRDTEICVLMFRDSEHSLKMYNEFGESLNALLFVLAFTLCFWLMPRNKSKAFAPGHRLVCRLLQCHKTIDIK